MQSLSDRIKSILIDVPDFPKPGILFKDITPIFKDPNISKDIIVEASKWISSTQPDIIVGLESRGFPFGFSLALALGKPFVMIRKKGKLPRPSYQVKYDLEYGTTSMELQIDDITQGQRVYIHDDLLATGGTASAAAELVKQSGGVLVGFGFLMTIEELNGAAHLKKHQVPIHSLVAV